MYLCSTNPAIEITMKYLEVCVETIQSIINAKAGGAYRIELCSALSEGGITPSYGMIETARKLGPEKLHVLIRPRGGNFIYSQAEVDCMIKDIKKCKELGVDGVVIGALTETGDIDIDACKKLMQSTEGMQATFHRAFDCCNNPTTALEQIISLGCTRLLTSGQANSATEGCQLIKSLVNQANGRIIIMPGAGVNENNAKYIISTTGATEIHGSIRSKTNHGLETNTTKVKSLITNINED